MKVLSRRKFLHLTRLAYLIIPAITALVTVVDPYAASNGEGILSFATITMSIFAWMAGGMAVADSVSSEKRDGTLGLLMMTPLNSYEILIAKSLSSSLNFFLAVLGMIPFLGLLILMGGIQPMDLFLGVACIFSCYFLSNSLGLLVSVNTYSSRDAWVYTMVTLVAAGLCFPLFSWRLSTHFNVDEQWINPLWAGYWFSYGSTEIEYKNLGTTASVISIYKLVSYQIAGAIGLGLALVALAGHTLNLAWKREKDARQKSGRFFNAWSELRQRLSQPIQNPHVTASRKQRNPKQVRSSDLTEISDGINPVTWFWGRNINLPIKVLIIFSIVEAAFLLLLLTIFVMWGELSGGDEIQLFALDPIEGPQLFILILTLLVLIDLFFKYMASLQIVRKIIEDKSNGGMEMLLTTPVTDNDVSQGILAGIHSVIHRYKLASVISFTVFGITLLFMSVNMDEVIGPVFFMGLFSIIIGISNMLDWSHLVRIGVILALKNKSIPGCANKAWSLCALIPTIVLSVYFLIISAGMLSLFYSHEDTTLLVILMISILITPAVIGMQIFNHFLSYRAILQFEFFRDAFQKILLK